MENLEEILKDEDDEIQEELSVILTKKGKVYFITPETTKDGINNTAKLIAHLIINWAHGIGEKLGSFENSSIVVPTLELGLPKKFK
jgi:hypothetical protein